MFSLSAVGSRALRIGLILVLIMAMACSSRAPSEERLHVFAASSLTEAFRDLARDFESQTPGTKVVLTFAGSQVLRLQIENGARAHVYASANQSHAVALETAGKLSIVKAFAHNELALIVPETNPSGIEHFADLSRAHRIVLGEASVPVGRYAETVLSRASGRFGAAFQERVMKAVVSREKNVRLVRAKVILGEADAALVYRSDALLSQTVKHIVIPKEFQAKATYFVGRVSDAEKRPLAEAWIHFLGSETGRKKLRSYGFLVP